MAEYIEREALLEQICREQCRCNPPQDEPCVNCYEFSVVMNAPAADVAPVVPELRKVVDLLNEEYEKAMQNTFINNPLAYALYQVWKAVDGTRNGR